MESRSAQRLQVLEGHIQPNQTLNHSKVTGKSDDDVVIVSFARTAMTKAKKGAQRETAPEAMLSVVLKDVIKKAGIDGKLIEDVCIGNVLQPGAGAHTARMATFLAGLPDTTLPEKDEESALICPDSKRCKSKNELLARAKLRLLSRIIFAVKFTMGSAGMDSKYSEYPTIPVREVRNSYDKRSIKLDLFSKRARSHLN